MASQTHLVKDGDFILGARFGAAELAATYADRFPGAEVVTITTEDAR